MNKEQLIPLAKKAGFTVEQVEAYLRSKQKKRSSKKRGKKKQHARKPRIFYGMNTNAM